MPTEVEREERALWKLSADGYTVARAGTGYIVTSVDGTETQANDLAALVAFADVMYNYVWIRKDHAKRVSDYVQNRPTHTFLSWLCHVSWHNAKQIARNWY